MAVFSRVLACAAVAGAAAGFLLTGERCDGDDCLADEGSLLQVNSARSRLVASTQKDNSVCPEVGMRGWLSTKAFDYISNKVFPFSIDSFETPTLPVPAISGTAGTATYTVDNFVLHSMSAETTSVELVANEGLRFSISGLACAVSMDYNLKSEGWIKLDESGAASATIGGDTSFSMFLRFSEDASGNPVTAPEDLQVNVKVTDINFQGGSMSGLVNMLKGAVVPAIELQAKAKITEAVNNYLNADVNTLLKSLDLGIPLNGTQPEPWNVNMKVCGVTITSDYIMADLYAAVEGANVYPATITTLAETPAASMVSSMFGASATEWHVNGMLWFLQQSGLLEASIDSPQAPESGAAGLTLNDFTTMDMTVIEPPKVDFQNGGFTANIDSQLAFVNDDKPENEVSVDVPVEAQATYSAGEPSIELTASGEPSDLQIGAGLGAEYQGKDAEFYSNLFLEVANENVDSLMNQLLAANEDGSKGVQIQNQQLQFTEEDVTAFADIEVDVKKLIETVLSSDLSQYMSR